MKKTLTHMMCLGLVAASSLAFAQEQVQERETVEPVFRVSKLSNSNNNTTKPGMTSNSAHKLDAAAIADAFAEPATPILEPNAASGNTAATATPHPLDQAINMAQVSLDEMREEVFDYTAIMVKREQVNGVVGSAGYMQLKVLCPRQTDAGATPFSVYMKFLKPRESAGREVIWVHNKNENKLSVHESSGVAKFKTFHLEPTCWLAMKDNRYPIYEAGLENLIVKLIEKAERDRAAGKCTVDYRTGAEINKRPCSVIEVIHKEKRAPYEFHKAQVFIDDELNLPIRYASYDWPATPGAKPQLQEEYTYINVKVNVGLTAKDFSTTNPAYKFPNR